MEKKSKTVKMDNAANQKLSYEQLEQAAKDLVMQRNQLQAQLQRAEQVINEFNDLGMLLSIVKQGENFHSEFIVRCSDRIEKLVTEALDNYDRAEAAKEAEKKEGQSNQ